MKEYKIHYTGFNDMQTRWMHQHQLNNCQDQINSYHAKLVPIDKREGWRENAKQWIITNYPKQIMIILQKQKHLQYNLLYIPLKHHLETKYGYKSFSTELYEKRIISLIESIVRIF